MDSNTNSFNANASATEDYAPVDGSWVAELEDAKAELEEIAGSPQEGGPDAAQQRRDELLHLHLRLSGACSMLRQWDALQKESKKGLKVCANYKWKRLTSATRISEWKARFASYHEQAQH
jgi:hypothetical protein